MDMNAYPKMEALYFETKSIQISLILGSRRLMFMHAFYRKVKMDLYFPRIKANSVWLD